MAGSIRIQAEGQLWASKAKETKYRGLHSTVPFLLAVRSDRSTVTREHMPPKALFDNKHRPDKLVMPACSECNRQTSTSDLVVSSVSRWGAEHSHSVRTDHAKLSAQAKIQAPELVCEWLSGASPATQLKARRHLGKNGVVAPGDANSVTIGPLTIRALNVFSHKAVLALYFEHFQRPLPNSGRAGDVAHEGRLLSEWHPIRSS